MCRTRADARALGLDAHADLHRRPPDRVDRRRAASAARRCWIGSLNVMRSIPAVTTRPPEWRTPARPADLVAQLHDHAAVHEAGRVERRSGRASGPAPRANAATGRAPRAGVYHRRTPTTTSQEATWPACPDGSPPSSRRRSTSCSTRPRIRARRSSTATRSRWSCSRTSRRASPTSSRPRSACSCSSRSSSSRSSSSTRRPARRSRRTARTSRAWRSSASSSPRASCSRSTSRSPSSRPSSSR